MRVPSADFRTGIQRWSKPIVKVIPLDGMFRHEMEELVGIYAKRAANKRMYAQWKNDYGDRWVNRHPQQGASHEIAEPLSGVCYPRWVAEYECALVSSESVWVRTIRGDAKSRVIPSHCVGPTIRQRGVSMTMIICWLGLGLPSGSRSVNRCYTTPFAECAKSIVTCCANEGRWVN